MERDCSSPAASSQIQLPLDEEASVSASEASAILGVSAATARNWARAGELVYRQDERLLFRREEVLRLKQKLESGATKRLRRRANKRLSDATFIPDEYAFHPEVRQCVADLVAEHHSKPEDVRVFLLRVILGLLGDLRNPGIETELQWWRDQAGRDVSKFSFSPPTGHEDLLGLLYQSLLLEGSKSSAGSYYTPSAVATDMLRSYVRSDSSVMDPCCGTGLFLLQAARIVSDPRKLWGYDVDELAVRIARINLLLRFPDLDFSPNVYVRDGLHPPAALFDVIATNPPWGANVCELRAKDFREQYDDRSNESFSFFIYASLRHLKPKGILTILLPEALLNIRTHSAVRRYLSTNSKILSIQCLGRVFKNVFTPVVRLDVENSAPSSDHCFTAVSKTCATSVKQSTLGSTPEHSFHVFVKDESRAIAASIFDTPHVTLRKNADWALGIVTGDNTRHLLEKRSPGSEPIFTGKELRRFVPAPPKRFIIFAPHQLQQVAPVERYRAKEKLLYRFISRELVFSYDSSGALALNSANIVIPRIDGYAIKTVLAFLNSIVFQFIFQTSFGALKILRGDLERLPFPNMPANLHAAVLNEVDVILNQSCSAKEKSLAIQVIDEIVMDAFHLGTTAREHLRTSVKSSTSYVPYSA